jgi:Heavy-metal-associated domain.
MNKEIKIEGMSCEHCKKHVEEALLKMNNTTGSVDLDNNKATIATTADDTAITIAIEEAGYKVVGIKNV